jgi:RNA methyltransferase, TrmH family
LQGTLLRTAAALGWQGAFLLPGCCDAFNDKALRAGRCASFQLPCATGSWDDLLHVVAAHQLTCLAAQLPERSGEQL